MVPKLKAHHLTTQLPQIHSEVSYAFRTTCTIIFRLRRLLQTDILLFALIIFPILGRAKNN